MLYQILSHTPPWVWAVLFALVWMGLAQTAPRRTRLRRVIGLPLAMTSLSLYGTLSVFGAVPESWWMWLGAGLITLVWVASSGPPADVRYDPAAQVFSLPGSWVPLVLMMAIFLTKYLVGVMLAMQPALAHDITMAAAVASLYGAMSGLFIGRMLRMLRLAHASAAKPDRDPPLIWG